MIPTYPRNVIGQEYATYRKEIEEFIKHEILTCPTNVLDPMVGTSQLIPFFEINGHQAFLYDILPLHFFLNSVKQYQFFKYFTKKGTEWSQKRFLDIMSPLRDKKAVISNKWIEDNILKGLIKAWNATNNCPKEASTLFKAFILVSIRNYSSFVDSQNPTWIKEGGISSSKDLEEIVTECVDIFYNYYLKAYHNINEKKKGRCVIGVKNATKLRLKNQVDVILTSPPSPNRLDYHRLFAPENYFLSKVGFPIETDQIIGTPMIKTYKNFKRGKDYITTKSNYLSDFINNVERKDKKPSLYYVRYYTRYFEVLFKVFENLLNYLSENGKIYMVIQDNLHRGELIEIDKALSDLFDSYGYKIKIMRKWARNTLGLRNVSTDYSLIRKIKQSEKIIKVYK